MANFALRLACMFVCSVLFVGDVGLAVGDDLNGEEAEASEQDAIIEKWDEMRMKMIDSVKPDPNFDRWATHEMKIRRTYQMFRVIEYLEAFDIHEERELLSSDLRARNDLSDFEADELRARKATLKKESQRVKKRIQRINSDENRGLEIRIDSKERSEQFDKINALKWKLPIDLTPRIIAA